MLRDLNPTDRRPLGEQIADVLAEAIADGVYPPGSHPPSRHELAERYGVAGQTAQLALNKLRDDGLVTASRGKRSVVVDFERAGLRPGETQLDRIERMLTEVLAKLNGNE